MKRISRGAYWGLVGASVLAFTLAAAAQVNPALYAGLKWRNVGPFHGGRIASVAGVIGQPNVYYFGSPQGGIWKTTSAGVTWFPISDQIHSMDSIGAIAVAPSDPNIVYAGGGDPILGSLGNGMWKSTDAGKTWTHIGLKSTVKICNILIDPKNPNLVVVAALGDAQHHGGGVWRTTNGGRSWKNVLKPKGYPGAREVEYDVHDPKIMLADTQGTGNPFLALLHIKPKHKPKPPLLFKSTNEGKSWKPVKIPPFPGRVAVAVCEHGRRIYIVGNNIEHGSGLFRSDNGGRTWKHMAGKDTRIANGQGAYSSGVFVDPQNPNVVYTVATAMYRSTDGGVTFHAFKGAPGGEDYHKAWIDPNNGNRMIIGADQGASVTLDGGHTWSLWYTEPISQIYKLATTAQYPYWIVGSQQDTGAVMIASRGNFGQVNFMDWSPLPSSEFGVITPDPLHPNILYGVGYGPGGGGGSELVRINMRTGQWENVAPDFGASHTKYRSSRDLAKKFDPFDPHALYAAYQCLMVTQDGGFTWHAFSPDLTTAKGKPMVACGTPYKPPKKAKHKGPRNPFGPSGPVLNGFSISKVTPGVFWTVSSNGQIYKSMDAGKTWTNVSNIAGAPKNTQFQSIIAGDAVDTAYVIGRVNGGGGFFGAPAPKNEDTDVPLIWRTTDGGQTWTSIVSGLPRDQRTGSWVNVLRADPKQPGLLFVGTETTVYVSFDNGDHWQSLRQNLPSTSIRDLVVHTQYHMNDLVICTYGRGFWVLDDFTPLRQIAKHEQAIASAPAYLYTPETAIRARINANWDQPFSIEMPYAPNPPYGVTVDYYLQQKPNGPIQLQVFGPRGHLVRTITSTPPPPIEGQAYPRYWLASPRSRALSTNIGDNRFTWNLRYNPPPAYEHDLENQMNMVAHSVTPGPHGPQVIPGVYTLKLTVGGQVYTRHVTVVNDPRVGQSPAMMAALRAQNRVTMLAYHGMYQTFAGRKEVEAVKAQLKRLMKGELASDVAAQAKTLEASLTALGGPKPGGGILAFFMRHRKPKPGALRSFVALNNGYNTLVSMMQVGLDMPPTPTQLQTAESDCYQYNRTVAAWKAMQTNQLAKFNTTLANNNLQQLQLAPVQLSDPACGF